MAVADEVHEARQEQARVQRQAAKDRIGKGAKPVMVEIVVTEFGDGLISTGEHVEGVGDLTHEPGETISVPEATATALRRRGFAELVRNKAA